MRIEDFNPDCFVNPESLDALADVFAILRKYCTVRARAMRSRIAGDIESATVEEAICDAVYEQLPEEVRW